MSHSLFVSLSVMAAIVLTSGCGSADASGKNKDQGGADARLGQKRFQCQSQDDWNCLQAYCQSEKGVWDETKKECTYPSKLAVNVSSFLSGDDRNFRTTVASPSDHKKTLEELYAGRKIALPVSIEGFNADVAFLRHRFSLSFGPFGPGRDILLDSLDDPNYFYSMDRTNPFTDISHVIHEPVLEYLTFALGDFSEGQPDESFFHFAAPKMNTTGNIVNMYVSGPVTPIQNQTEKARKELLPDQRLLNLVADSLASFSTRDVFNPDNVEMISSEGCARFCIAHQTLNLGANGRLFSARWVKAYGKGRVLRQYVEVRQRDTAENPLLVVFYNLGGGVSHVVTFLDVLSDDRGLPARIVRIFDRFGTALMVTYSFRKGEITGFDNASQQFTKVDDVTSKSPQSGPKVAVCDGGFDWLWRDPILERIAFGPYAASPGSYRGSRFGWLANHGASLDLYFDKHSSQGWIGKDSEVANNHAKQVLKILSEASPTVQIVPISEASCFKMFQEWHGAAVDSGVKVVNVSLASTGTAAACAKTHAGQAVLRTSKTLLWVTAAGNSREQTGDHPEIDCPQMLGLGKGQPNLLVVAALEGNTEYLAEVSNRGVDYADVAASGKCPTDAIPSATSFAAPRVSAAVAEAADRYPMLSPRDLRMAVLLSARLPISNRPLPVRSGGIFDAKTFEVVAKGMAGLSEQTRSGISVSKTANVTVLVRQAFCGKPDVNCRDAKRKLSVLESNGVLQ